MDNEKTLTANEMTITANRQYKSTMFSMIFRERKELLELYNAVNHSAYTNPEELEVVTLENAIYINMKNDLAFIIDMHLNLYEHQSTFCPNMPLRDLFYVAREYEALVKDRTIYSSTLLRIPAPRFLVFYNGREIRPEREVLKLSDAFLTRDGRPEENPELELRVMVLNINTGNNAELMKNCRTLKEYMQYVECVRRHLLEAGDDLTAAVKRAVNECIGQDVLAEFLSKNRAEAISMSIFEYNEAEEKEKIRRAEYEGGFQDGIRQGMEQGIEQGIKTGLEQGIEQGMEQGMEQNMLNLIEKKLQKGKTIAQIADELEVEPAEIERILREHSAE